MNQLTFHELFRKYRLRSEFETFTELGEALAEKGLIYENSIFSHWQKGTRIPTNRFVLLKLLEVFIEREAITNLESANNFLSSAGHGNITEWELEKMNLPRAFLETDDIDKKLQTAKNILEEFPTILQSINTSFPEFSQNEITFSKGVTEVRKLYHETLKVSEQRSYIDLNIVKKVFPENFFLFNDAFKHNLKIRMYEIVDGSKLSAQAAYYFSRNKRYACKFLPKGLQLAPIDTIIHDGKVSIINLEGQIVGITLENAGFYENSKQIFDFMWNSLPEVKKEQLDLPSSNTTI